MSNDENMQEKAFTEKGMAFFGAVMASISHELNNVVGIVDQSAGLLDDLLLSASRWKPVPEEKLKKIAERISNQTQRGVGLIKRMNRFAHSTDDAELEFDLNDTIENLTELTRRKATLKKAELSVSYCNDPIRVKGSPFLIQQALYMCILHTLDDAKPDDNTSVSVTTQENQAVITVEGRKPQLNEIDDLDYLRLMIIRLNGTLESNIRGELVSFRILIPVTGR